MKRFYSLFVSFLMLAPLAVNAQDGDYKNVPVGTVEHTVERKELMIPNAFSPNGDGQNDYFKISNITDEKLIDFKVFNRWGTILFRTSDPRQGWDGNYKGQPQPFGVYGYVIRIAYADGYVETYKGTVTLIK
jgi:gliding motility-associated-like protein